ncbi:hypothetical protein ABBQ38_008024 [Trebouxia sp. C0009 RCD-2024]
MQLTLQQMSATDEAKSLICELCRNFYQLGWVGGTGGGMSVKTGDLIVMAPSGVQKERMIPEDMFVLDQQGNVLVNPIPRPSPYKPPKLSECSPLFMAAFELRSAGAVMHSHSLNAVLATLIDPTASEFTVTNLEMIKGIAGHGYYDNCTVPIIENTARECELTDRLRQAIKDYPKSQAVLVRRHGVYVWGSTWIQAKTQAECYDYLFEAALKMKAAVGIDASQPATRAPAAVANGVAQNGHAHGSERPTKRHKASAEDAPRAIVLDIEGTVAPISFVYDVLFPYAKKQLTAYLEKHWESAELQAELQQLQAQAKEHQHMPGAQDVLSANKATAIAGIQAFVEGLMREDKKLTILKTLQGHIWQEGFAKGELTADLYEDVQPAMAGWVSQGIKIYIYSSGSREAQRNLFGHSKDGDLRGLLSGFFDTSSGSKVESSSYQDIALSLGVDKPSLIMFATDSFDEAEAASAAGWRVALTIRPGNKPLPSRHDYREISSMQHLLTPF